MGELFYIVDLLDGEVVQTTDKALVLQYVESDKYVAINVSTGVYFAKGGEEQGIPHL